MVFSWRIHTMSYRADHRQCPSKPAILLITLSAFSLLPIAAWGADKSLVLYLPLNDGSGTVVKDLSSYTNDGQIVGNASWVEGKTGQALEFVSGSRVTVPEIPQYDVTAEVSLLAWVRTSDVPNWARV